MSSESRQRLDVVAVRDDGPARHGDLPGEHRSLAPAIEHDPEKACPGLDPGREPVFGKNHAPPDELERDDDSKNPAVAAGNVVPFVRPGAANAASAAPAAELDRSQRPVPYAADRVRRGPVVACLALSLAAHGGLYWLFNRPPEPLATIALAAISVEIVLGADTQAGLAVTPGEAAASASADDPDPPSAKAAADPPRDESPADADPVVHCGAGDTMREEPTRSETPPEPAAAALPAEPQPAAPAVLPQQPEQQAAPERSESRSEPEAGAKPVPRRETRPPARSKPKQERPDRRVGTAAAAVESGPQSRAASGIGLGRAFSDTNYRGVVFAHLARHKQFPSDARNRGEQGSATVAFSFDGAGRVTRVSLVRSSGFSALDHEAQAMVRRASPFPAPPDGRPASFTAPVSFRIQ